VARPERRATVRIFLTVFVWMAVGALPLLAARLAPNSDTAISWAILWVVSSVVGAGVAGYRAAAAAGTLRQGRRLALVVAALITAYGVFASVDASILLLSDDPVDGPLTSWGVSAFVGIVTGATAAAVAPASRREGSRPV
jgi:hypothetical protein